MAAHTAIAPVGRHVFREIRLNGDGPLILLLQGPSSYVGSLSIAGFKALCHTRQADGIPMAACAVTRLSDTPLCSINQDFDGRCSSSAEQGIPEMRMTTCVHHPDSYRLYTDDAPGVEGSHPYEKGSTAYGAAGRGQFKSTVNYDAVLEATSREYSDVASRTASKYTVSYRLHKADVPSRVEQPTAERTAPFGRQGILHFKLPVQEHLDVDR